MRMNTLVTTYFHCYTVNEADAGTFSKSWFEEHGKENEYTLLQLHETTVGDHAGKHIFHITTNQIVVIMFESPMASIVKDYHDGDYLRIGELSCPIAALFIIGKLKLFGSGYLFRKLFAKIIHATENFYNFIPVIHKQKFCSYLSFNTLKMQTFDYIAKYIMRNSR